MRETLVSYRLIWSKGSQVFQICNGNHFMFLLLSWASTCKTHYRLSQGILMIIWNQSNIMCYHKNMVLNDKSRWKGNLWRIRESATKNESGLSSSRWTPWSLLSIAYKWSRRHNNHNIIPLFRDFEVKNSGLTLHFYFWTLCQ